MESYLFADLVKPVLYFGFVFLGVGLFNLFWAKVKCEKAETIVLTLMLLTSIPLTWNGFFGRTFMGTILTIFLMSGCAASAAVFFANYIPMKVSDYIQIVFIVFILNTNFYGFSVFFLISLLGIWWVLICITARRFTTLKKGSLSCFLSYVAALIGYAFFDILYENVFNKVYQYFLTHFAMERWSKAIVLLLMTSVIIGVLFLVLYGLKVLLRRIFDLPKDLPENYNDIGIITLLIPFFLPVLLYGLDAMIFISNLDWMSLINGISFIFVSVIFGTQLVYIRLMIRTLRLKEHIKRQEAEQNSLKEYNSRLAENMNEIRAIKHDIKNVFLTMGEFVDRSDDDQMKRFYKEKIVPFASQGLKKNDLYVELEAIPNEALRAFFYYKMEQGINRGVDIHLMADMDGSFFYYFPNLPDIIRVIGIFTDNAIEEAILLEEPKVIIVIREKQGSMSLQVKNNVRESVQKSGVVAGTSSKGLGRGMGILIAKEIIERYDNLLWNSYFQDNMFVQIISSEGEEEIK